jgi:hypothetical protein
MSVFDLNDRQVADFFRRSYTAIDGLWFMKVQERHGFDDALDIDDDVWKVFPKVQARMLRDMGGAASNIEGLRESFTTKLAVEAFQFDVKALPNGFQVNITRCPWHEAMVKSGREALSGKVGSRICGTEYAVWAAEFGPGIRFERRSEICTGGERCVLEFTQ